MSRAGSPSDSNNELQSLMAPVVKLAARLQRAAQEVDAFEVLCEEFATFLPFQNYIVYVFRDNAPPVLIETNLGLPWLRNRMADYINGLYALDPFHRLTLERTTGLFRMQDIMPEAFLESEYFNHFYHDTSVADEVRYVVRSSPDTSIHVAIEREGEDSLFNEEEMQILRGLMPLVCAFVEAQQNWERQMLQAPASLAPAFDFRAQIGGLKGGVLTPREIDTVELMLKGHSTKSLARVLGIDDGTVANHKRNIYSKLDVHSAAQLFDLFLRSLTQDS